MDKNRIEGLSYNIFIEEDGFSVTLVDDDGEAVYIEHGLIPELCSKLLEIYVKNERLL